MDSNGDRPSAKARRRTGTQIHEWQKGEYLVTTEQRQLDLDALHRFLAQKSYWARRIPRSVFERSLKNSLCFGLFQGKKQIGFARCVSDFATVAYLSDVFVLPQYRGRGLAKWLIHCVTSHPELRNLRRWILVTRDAHSLYRKHGFSQLAHPESFMEIHNPEVYRNPNAKRA